jgi:ketosteroid isomerase-like protein
VITRPNGTKFYTRSVHALEKRGGKWVVVSNAGHPLDDGGTLLFLEHEWADAAVKKDTAWFERNFADDFTSINAENGALRNKREAIDSLKNVTIDAVDLSEMNVRVEGNTAVVTGVVHEKGKDVKAATFDRTARFSDVFVKRDGRWQVLSTQETAVKK